jgi:hypothetical protein
MKERVVVFSMLHQIFRFSLNFAKLCEQILQQKKNNLSKTLKMQIEIHGYFPQKNK